MKRRIPAREECVPLHSLEMVVSPRSSAPAMGPIGPPCDLQNADLVSFVSSDGCGIGSRMATLLKVLNNLADIKSAGCCTSRQNLVVLLTHCSKINDLEGEPQMKGAIFRIGSTVVSASSYSSRCSSKVDRSLFAFGDAHTGPNVTATQDW